MTSSRTLEEYNAFMRQVKWFIAAVVALFLVPLIIYGFYLDRRLTSFEDSLRYRPPEKVEVYGINNFTEDLPANPVQGQVVYVPVYSHVYHDDGAPYLLTITLSVRNTSLSHAIVVKSVRYFDTNGKEVKSHLTKPLRMPPLSTTEFLVERDDATGGSGANFLVEWIAEKEVTEPIIEAVMIDTKGQQGISFARNGRPIHEVVPTKDDDKERWDATSTPSESESR